MPNERETLKNAIDKYLKTLAPDVWFMKSWGGGIYGRSGVSDYLVCAWGRFGVIEAKHPNGNAHMDSAQNIFQKKIMHAGGFIAEVTTVRDVEYLMEQIAKKYG